MAASIVLQIVLGLMAASAWALLIRDSMRDRDRGL